MKRTKNIVMTGVFAALICFTTAYILHIPVPNGYIHLGDVFIYMASSVLPFPFGLAASAIGGALADIFSGYPVYVLPTVIIKSLNSLCFYALGRGGRLMSVRTVFSCVISCAVTVVGYYAAAAVLFGNPKAQLLGTVPANAVQGAASGFIFCIIAIAADKSGIKLKMQ